MSHVTALLRFRHIIGNALPNECYGASQRQKITKDALYGLCFAIQVFIYYFRHFLFVTEMSTCLLIRLSFLFMVGKGFCFFWGHPFPFSPSCNSKDNKSFSWEPWLWTALHCSEYRCTEVFTHVEYAISDLMET